MNIRILRILLFKEIQLLKRHPIVPKIIVVLPVMAMLILPLVANLDIRSVGVAVVDNDCSELSRCIVSDMAASENLVISGVFPRYDRALEMVERGDADVILTIPSNYSRDLERGLTPTLALSANGVNATKGMLGSRYAAQSSGATVSRWMKERAVYISSGLSTVQDFQTKQDVAAVLNLYNPTLNFRNYMIPALMVVLIIIICGFLPTLNLVTEKESGTIEAMNVSPVGKFTFVLSKLIPYWIIGLIVITVGLIVGWLVYGLVPVGNVILIYLAAILFSLVMSGLGVTIANRSSTILQSIFVIFAFIVIFQLMSGLFTPISSMPQWAQYATYAIPPRYFIEIMRAVYLKGATFCDLWRQYMALAGFAVMFFIVATFSYSKRS